MRAFGCILAAVLLGCDGGAAKDPPQPPLPVIDPATAGTIRGKALFQGRPPSNPGLPVGGNAECAALHSGPAFDEVYLVKDGRLQNAFVYVKEGLEKLAFPWPTTPATIANEKCVYRPRVSGAQVHQPIRFTNEDPTDHNIHGFTSKGPFNFTLRGKGQAGQVKVRQTEVMMSVKCDFHNWMLGYVGVLPHPFFQVTGADGAFELKGLPPGEYTVEAWHERLGRKSARVELRPGQTAGIELAFGP